MTEIIITSVKVLGEPIEIPGLPKLLANCWVPGQKETKCLHTYNREVIRKEGRLVTVLTKKKKVKEVLK